MLKHIVFAAALMAASTAFSQAQDVPAKAPPPAPYAAVSKLVKLPDFLPGLGQLYVDPAKLPAGPFLGYDHDGKLSATIYMVPIADLQAGKAFNDLAVGAKDVAGVDIYFNAGHPGVEQPHAHVVLYHDAEAKKRLAK